ncbi:MAG: tRNA-dihydrouridine synthase, partial [Atopobium sp.]|nr:tRNA-dihydrouridine synthase [Atopobium sp.]
MESLQTIIATCAPEAGLSSRIIPFALGTSLKERLSANPVLMAPMAGVSDGVYRTMARAGGAGLAYSEMVSVAGIHYGGDKTWELVEPLSTEPDIAVQLFGS